jgi:sec-independent protein translocase protein TatA
MSGETAWVMFEHGIGGWELLIVAAVFMAMFGAKRLPDSARSLGRSMHILKSEIHGLQDDNDKP